MLTRVFTEVYLGVRKCTWVYGSVDPSVAECTEVFTEVYLGVAECLPECLLKCTGV